MKSMKLILATALIMLLAVGIASAVETPVITFSGNVTEGTVQLPVKFTATLTPPGDMQTYYKWDFGDGSTATQTGNAGKTATHTYQNVGKYSVTLEVKERSILPEWTTVLSKEEYIFVWHATVTPSFSASASVGVGPFPATFTSTTPGYVHDYEWAIVNNVAVVYTGNGNEITYEFPQVPDETTYEVLMVANNEGGEHKPAASKIITVKPQAPVAAFSASTQIGVKPLYVQFSDMSTGSELSWNWNFGFAGAGNTSTSQNPNHIFTETGTYIINLNVSSGSGGEFGYDTALPLTIVVMNNATDVCPEIPEPTIVPTSYGTVHNGVWNIYGVSPFNYGIWEDTPLLGDWDNDGVKTAGVYRNGVFHLKNSNSDGGADIAVHYGLIGDTPIVGDWNGDGTDTVGIIRNGKLYLRNSNTDGYADIVFGQVGNIPVIG